jgi:hypothetical protein
MKKNILIIAICFLVSGNIGHGQDFAQDYIGSVNMSGEFLDGDILLVQVKVEDMTDPILGSSFNLAYDASKLNFLRYEPGNFLERGGNPFYLVKNQAEKNSLVFGATLRSEDNFPRGGGLLADFYFQIKDGDKFGFEFENEVISTLDTVRQDLDMVIWEDLFIEKNDRNGQFGANENLEINLGNNSLNWSEKFSNPIFVLTAISTILLLLGLFRLKYLGDKRPA